MIKELHKKVYVAVNDILIEVDWMMVKMNIKVVCMEKFVDDAVDFVNLHSEQLGFVLPVTRSVVERYFRPSSSYSFILSISGFPLHPSSSIFFLKSLFSPIFSPTPFINCQIE